MTEAPLAVPKASFLQRLGDKVSSVRDPHIVRLIAEQLKKYKKVMIVFGGGHLVSQRPVIEKYFGPSRDEQIDKPKTATRK